MRELTVALVTLVIVAANSPAFATDVNSDTIMKVEQAFAKTEKTTANFTQTMKSKGFGVTGSFSGRVYLEKPNLMRWEYEEPAGRIMVADGEKLWFFDPEEGVVRVGELSNILSETSPALFLAGEAMLSELFIIDLAPPKNDNTMNTIRLKLFPIKPMTSVKAMLLEVNGDDYKIVALTMVDYLGNKNRIDFFDAKTPPEPAKEEKSRYQFKPPPGVPVKKMTP